VLLLVLVVVAMLALGSYSFVQLMNAEAHSARSAGRIAQARTAAESGVHYVAALLVDQKLNGSLGADLYNSADLFHAQLVTDESSVHPHDRCRFSVVAPVEEDQTGASWRYGLIDEAGRINLNALPQATSSQGSQGGAGTGGGGATGAANTSAGGSGGSAGSGASSTSGATGSEPANPLLGLPNMTSELADAILDFIDEDDDPRPAGAESDYYQSLTPPYRAKNGPIRSLDELLLVSGVTPRLLYGEDANRNGVLDPNEDDGELSYPSDDSNGTLDRGWLPYLTLYSRESNTDNDGLPRINLNNSDLAALYDELSQHPDFGEEPARFIVAYRLFGPASANQNSSGQNSAGGSGGNTGDGGSSPGQQPSSSPGGSSGQGSTSQGGGGQTSGAPSTSTSTTTQEIAGLDASGGAKQQIQSVMDLIGANVSAKVVGQQQNVTLPSPYQEPDMPNYLDVLLDRATTVTETELKGRINVNSAPAPVLMAVPGMTEEMAAAIEATRPQIIGSTGQAASTGVEWLLSGGAVTRDQFKQIEPHITGRSQTYRVQIVAYFEDGGPYARVEAVIDLSGPSPLIREWHDLRPLGRGFDAAALMGSSGP
jgi:type II secretory pathway component PulK